MSISFSGLSSGLDTTSWVESLTALKKAKVTSLQEEQSVVQTAKEALTNIRSFFTSFRSLLEKVTDTKFNIASTDLFAQKLATSSNASIVSALAKAEAEEGTYEVKVDKLAGNTKATSKYKYTTTVVSTTTATYDSLLKDIGITAGEIGVTVNGAEQVITLTNTDTLNSLANKLKGIGVEANYNEKTGVFSMNLGSSSIRDIGNTGIIDGLHLTNVNKGYSSDTLEKKEVTTTYNQADRNTKLSDLGVNAGTLSITTNDAVYSITLDNDDTLGDLLDALNNNGINASLQDGTFTLEDAEITSDGTTGLMDAFGLSGEVSSNIQQSGSLSYQTITTTTTKATSDTLLKDLSGGEGIQDGDTVIIKKDSGAYATITLSSTSTIQNLVDEMNNAGLTASMSNGRVSLSGGEITGGSFDAMGVLDLAKTSSNTTSYATSGSNRLIASGGTFTASRNTTFKELGFEETDDISLSLSNGATITMGVNDTLSDLIDKLDTNGIDATISNGVMSFNSTDGTYISGGNLADKLGIATTTSTQTVSNAQTSTAAITATTTVAADRDTKLVDLGIAEGYFVINFEKTGASGNLSGDVTSTTTVGDLLDLINSRFGSYGITASISDGVISIDSTDGGYIFDHTSTSYVQVLASLGISTEEHTGNTVTVGGATTLGPYTYAGSETVITTTTVTSTSTQKITTTETVTSDGTTTIRTGITLTSTAPVTYTLSSVATTSTQIKDINGMDSNTIVIKNSESDAALKTITVSGSETIQDLFDKLSSSGYYSSSDFSMSDGVISISSSAQNGATYLDGSLLTDLGIGLSTTITTSTTSGTVTVTVGSSWSSTAQVDYTSTSTATVSTTVTVGDSWSSTVQVVNTTISTATVSTTVTVGSSWSSTAQITCTTSALPTETSLIRNVLHVVGADVDSYWSFTVKQDGTSIATFTLDKTSATLQDLFDELAGYGLTGSITNGVISIENTDDTTNVSSTILTIMGCGYSSETRTISSGTTVSVTVGASWSSSSAVTYTAVSYATESTKLSDINGKTSNTIYITATRFTRRVTVGTVTTSASDTLGDLFNYLSLHTISGSVTNGRVVFEEDDSLTPSGRSLTGLQEISEYIDFCVEDASGGDLLSSMGISTQSNVGTTTRTISSVTTTTQSVTLSYATKLTDIGFSTGEVIKLKYGDCTAASYTVTAGSTVIDLEDMGLYKGTGNSFYLNYTSDASRLILAFDGHTEASFECDCGWLNGITVNAEDKGTEITFSNSSISVPSAYTNKYTYTTTKSTVTSSTTSYVNTTTGYTTAKKLTTMTSDSTFGELGYYINHTAFGNVDQEVYSNGQTYTTNIIGTTTVGDFVSWLNDKGFTASVSGGKFYISGAENVYMTDMETDIDDVLGLPDKAGLNSAYTVQTKQQTGTTTITAYFNETSGVRYDVEKNIADGSTTFGEIGLDSVAVTTVYANGTTHYITVTTSSTINDFIDELESYGFTASISNGEFYISGAEGVYVKDLNYYLDIALKLYNYYNDTAYSTVINKSTTTTTATCTLTSDSTFGELGLTSTVTQTIFADGTYETMRISTTTTVGDFVSWLNNNGFTASVSNGKFYISGAEGVYVTDMNDSLDKVLKLYDYYNSNAYSTVINKSTTTTTVTHTLTSDTTFGELGLTSYVTQTIFADGTYETMRINTTTTVGDFVSWLNSNGFTASVSNGKFNISGAEGVYVKDLNDQLDSALNLADYYYNGSRKSYTTATRESDEPVTITTSKTYNSATGNTVNTNDVRTMTESTTFAELGLTDETIRIKGSRNGTVIETELSNGDTVGDLLDAIYAASGTVASISDGILTIEGADNSYLCEISSYNSNTSSSYYNKVARLLNLNIDADGYTGNDSAVLEGITYTTRTVAGETTTQTITTTQTVVTTTTVTQTSTSVVSATQAIAFISPVTRRDTSGMTALSSVDASTELTSGTYSISTTEELAKLATMTNNGKIGSGTEFVLANDIDLSAYSSGEGWTPIGNAINIFHATFDGNGYTISNLYINRSSADNQGLFGETSSSQISNIALENVNVTGRKGVGGLVGVCYGTIKNCYVTGTVTGSENVGGLAGRADIMTNCLVKGTVTGSKNVGGLVGLCYGTIKNCGTTGVVTGDKVVGGLIGCGDYLRIYDSYATGVVTGYGSNVGGLAGKLADSHLTNCYATGTVTGYDSNVGGLIGNSYSGTLSNAYFADTTGQAKGIGTIRGASTGTLTLVTTSELDNLIAQGTLPDYLKPIAQTADSSTEIGTFSSTPMLFTVSSNGTISTLTFSTTNTLGDVMSGLEEKGFTVNITDGTLNITGKQNVFLVGDSGNTTTVLTGYTNTDSNYLSETKIGTITGDTTISEITGIDASDTMSYSASGVSGTAIINGSDTLNEFFNKISALGLTGSVSNGVITIQGNGDNHLTDTSSTFGLGDVSYTTATGTANTNSNQLIGESEVTADTLTKLGDIKLADGSSPSSFDLTVNDKLYNFTSDNTIQDVINSLSADGYNVSISGNGQISITSSTDPVVSGSLSSVLLGDSPNTRTITSGTTSYTGESLSVSDIQTLTASLTKETLLSSLGVTGGEFAIVNNGVRYKAMVSSSDTVEDFMDTLNTFGLQAAILETSDGTVLKIIGNGDSYIEKSTSSTASNIVDVLFPDTKQTSYNYASSLQTSEITTATVKATTSTLLSDYDSKWGDSTLKSEGTLSVTVDGESSIIRIGADETFGSLMSKFEELGVETSLIDGKLVLQAGQRDFVINSSASSSNLVANLGLNYSDDLGGYSASSEEVKATVETVMEKERSVANNADFNTKMSLVNISSGSLALYRNGVKATIQINEDETFAQLRSRISSAFSDVDISLDDGYLKIYSKTDGVEVVAGSISDTSNISAVLGLSSSENAVISAREIYKVDGESVITDSGLFRRGDVTEGTFIIGNATFTIDSKTTLDNLVTQINASEEANATAYWDAIDGKLVINSRSSGASFINIEKGTSNFTDIMGYTTTSEDGTLRLETTAQEIGSNAKFSINGTNFTSSSNTVTSDISRIKGVTLNLNDISNGETVTITIEKSSEKVTDAMEDIVEAYNNLIENVDKEISTTGNLSDQSTLKIIRNQLRSLMTSSSYGNSVFSNLDAVGIALDAASANDISTNNINKLHFDRDKFIEAYNTDSSALKSLLVGTDDNLGILSRVENLIESSLASVTGYFDTAENSFTSQIKRYSDKITKANNAVSTYKARLEAKFQTMDMLISNIQNQYSSFLTGS